MDIGTDFNTNVQDKNAWSKLSWADASFGGNPGKGQLSDNGQTYTLNATSDGLLVAWRDTSGGKNHGALYVKDKKLAMAWQAVATHLLGFKAKKWNIDNFFAITKDNVAVPYVLATAPKNNGKSHLFTHTKIEEAQFATTAGFGTVGNFSMAKFAQSSTVAFLVSQNGISKLPVGDAGSATRFSAVAKNTPTFGSNAWNLGDPMTDNFNVSCVLVINDKLYVGLDAVHDFQGGVAILDIATDTLIPPKKAIWNRVKIRHLFADSDSKVWAVTPKELIEVKSDGTMGEKLNAAAVAAKQAKLTGDNPQAGYKGEMPGDDIFGAVAVGKSLLVTTEKHAYVLMNKTAAVVD